MAGKLTGKYDNTMRWYIVHTHSQFEKKVVKILTDRIAKEGMEDMFGEIYLPINKVIGAGKDPNRVSERKFFPSYLLIQMILNDETWSLVKNTPKVTYFVGYKNRPQAVPEREVERIKKKEAGGATQAVEKVQFQIGDLVKVTNGPFQDFTGVIDEVDDDKLRVLINIFGRETPVELGPDDVIAERK